MKEAAEVIDRLFTHLATFLRYVAPGFAALYVVAIVIPGSQCFLRSGSKEVVALGVLLGFAIYAVHTGLLGRPLWFLIMRLHMCKCSSVCKAMSIVKRLCVRIFKRKSCGKTSLRRLLCLIWRFINPIRVCKCKLVRTEMSKLEYQRWLRRESDDKRVQSIQKELDKWAAMLNFTYCLSYTMILIPLGSYWFSVKLSEWSCRVFWIGWVVLLIGLFSDWRITEKEIKISDECEIPLPRSAGD